MSHVSSPRSALEHMIITLDENALPQGSGSPVGDVYTIAPGMATRLGVSQSLRQTLPQLIERLEAKVAALPEQSQAHLVWLVASLDEVVSRGALLDLAALIRSIDLKRKLELHALICLPENPGTADSAVVEAGALLRELSRTLLIYGQQPPLPSRFATVLMSADSGDGESDARLLTTCTLLTSDRPTQTLRGVPLDQGLYPMLADVIRVLTERPAAGMLQAMQHDSNTRLTTKQRLDGQTLFSGIGCYTWHFPAQHLIHEAADSVLAPLLGSWLGPTSISDSALAECWQRMARQHDVALYRGGQTVPHMWEQADIFALLERRETRGVLSDYARNGLPQRVRFDRLVSRRLRTTEALRQHIKSYGEQHLGTPAAAGDWRSNLAASRAIAVQTFEATLYDDVVDQLNQHAMAGGKFAYAEAFIATMKSHLQGLIPSLNAHAATLDQTLPELKSTAEQLLQAANGYTLGDIWRRLRGDVTTKRHEAALAAWQDVYAAELETLAAAEAAATVQSLTDVAERLAEQIRACREQVQAQHTASVIRQQRARERRVNQINLFRVRHEWGMPHDEIGGLREWLDPERWERWPNGNDDRAVVEQWREYIDGRHLARLIAQRQIDQTALTKRIHWSWREQQGQRTLVGGVTGSDGTTILSLFDEATLRDVTRDLFGWLWKIALSELWLDSYDTAGTEAAQKLAQRLTRISSAAIKYVPTSTDAHEEHTYLIAVPSQQEAIRQFFTRIEAAQMLNARERRTFKHVAGSDPHRITLVHRLELIGALAPGALPVYDQITASYSQNTQLGSHIAPNEALAARFEQVPAVCGARPLSPLLVDSLYSAEYFDYFVQSIAHNRISIQYDSRNRTANEQIIFSNGSKNIILADASSEQPWISALRVFMVEIAPTYTALLAMDPDLSNDAYYAIIDSNNGVIARLKTSSNAIERDLADISIIRLEQFAETATP